MAFFRFPKDNFYMHIYHNKRSYSEMPYVCYLHVHIIIIKSEMDRFIPKGVTINYCIQSERAHLKRGDYEVHNGRVHPKG